MLIFSEKLTPRIEYTFEFLFSQRGVSYEIITDLDKFKQSEGPKLNYSNQNLVDVKTIKPSKVLFEDDVRLINLTKGLFNNMEVLVFDDVIDPIAAIFYVLTRYEEYTEKAKDTHGRFEAKNSIQSTYNWLEIPICDVWCEGILSFVGIEKTQNHRFEIIPTFDIDSTYAYLHKGILRQTMGWLKDVMKFDYPRINERIKTLLRLQKDPFDNFDKIENIASKFPMTRCFWLLADHGRWDKNLSYTNPAQQRVIQSTAAFCKVGLHPGYTTYLNRSILENEKSRLATLLKTTPTESRQHYLRLQIPETYHTLIDSNISTDYTMGYAECIGFRAGTAKAHPWFDLSKNEPSTLIIQPFCYMDGTLNEYLKLSPQIAIEKVKELKSVISQYGGNFCFIWHNETIGFQHHWEGWQGVLEASLQ